MAYYFVLQVLVVKQQVFKVKSESNLCLPVKSV